MLKKSTLRKDIQQANVDMLREMHIEPTALDNGNDASENIGIFNRAGIVEKEGCSRPEENTSPKNTYGDQ